MVLNYYLLLHRNKLKHLVYEKVKIYNSDALLTFCRQCF
jgi:hypothetical protein